MAKLKTSNRVLFIGGGANAVKMAPVYLANLELNLPSFWRAFMGIF
ncbi:MAG: hypothetical protein ACTSRZ_11130 [Promethearchaeota archaeon]